MADIQEITGNHPEITESLTLLDLRNQLDHMDETIHGLQRQVQGLAEFVEEHRPALSRALRFLDNPVTRYKQAMARGRSDGRP